MGKLSNIEWTTCWMSIRYALGRRSAASASLPVDLLAAYYDRWTSDQCYAILCEIRDYRSKYGPSIGDPAIDDVEWTKLEKTLDSNCHVGVDINGSFVSGFLYKEGFYPISSGWVWWERNTYFPVSEFKDGCSLSIIDDDVSKS